MSAKNAATQLNVRSTESNYLCEPNSKSAKQQKHGTIYGKAAHKLQANGNRTAVKRQYFGTLSNVQWGVAQTFSNTFATAKPWKMGRRAFGMFRNLVGFDKVIFLPKAAKLR